MGVEIWFTKRSSRKHKVGRARALHALLNAVAVVEVERPDGSKMLMHLGDDETGRALEVGVIIEDDVMIVLHVMDLRNRFRAHYEAGKEGL